MRSLVESSNSRVGLIDCSIGNGRTCFVFVGDDVFDEKDDEDVDDGMFVAVGRLGGRRDMGRTLPRRNGTGLDC